MLVPLRILWRDPKGLNSADSPGVCCCDDSCEYVLKDSTSHPRTPHNEWFCNSLATSVGIAGPAFGIVQESPVSLLFGSRWEGGVAKDNWWDMVDRGEITFDDIKPALSRILVFDHFVHNIDRHANNYLVREQRNGWAILALDYSRAWLYHGFPLPSLPFTRLQNTRRVFRYLQKVIGSYLVLDAVDECIDRLVAITDVDIANILDRHPDAWLTGVEKRNILSWWRSPLRLDRLHEIQKGIKDGSYL